MRYNNVKKLIILLLEYFDKENDDNGYLEQDLLSAVYEIRKYDYIELYDNKAECMQQLPFENIEELIRYLDNLDEQIAINEMERGIARSEAFGDFIYENGYESYFEGGF